MEELYNNFVAFIQGIIDTIKNLVASIRAFNDGKTTETTTEEETTVA